MIEQRLKNFEITHCNWQIYRLHSKVSLEICKKNSLSTGQGQLLLHTLVANRHNQNHHYEQQNTKWSDACLCILSDCSVKENSDPNHL